MKDNPQFGSCIKAARLAAKMTQQALADASGVALSSLKRYESGEREPRHSALKQIANALGVDVNRLIYGETPEEAEAGFWAHVNGSAKKPVDKTQAMNRYFGEMNDAGQEKSLEYTRYLWERSENRMQIEDDIEQQQTKRPT